MQIRRVHAVYFSGTGTTEKTVRRIAAQAAQQLGAELSAMDFTPPQARQETLHFAPEELVIFGVPTYAGRVPNVLLPFLKERVQGGGALAAAVVLFGNRNFDDSLIELRDILRADGFAVVGGAAFVGEHSFSRTLGAGRPDAADMAEMDAFARALAEKVRALPVELRQDVPLRTGEEDGQLRDVLLKVGNEGVAVDLAMPAAAVDEVLELLRAVGTLRMLQRLQRLGGELFHALLRLVAVGPLELLCLAAQLLLRPRHRPRPEPAVLQRGEQRATE